MIFHNSLFKFSRSHICDKIKRICAIEFANDIDEIVELLNFKIPGKIPKDDEVKREIATLLKNDCKIITINDEKYPKLLKKIISAPIILTVKGNANLLKTNSIAVVGNRNIKIEDFSIIREVVKNINSLNLCVISGLAKGSDIIAHIQSVKTGTITVLPCGLKYCYPKEHESILNKIIEMNGAAISIFNFFEPPKRFNFIKRNNVIVGVSDAVIAMRASTIKCGTMMSAILANRMKRSIYTLNFNSENEGNKYLLANNLAKEITSFVKLKYQLLIDIAKNEIHRNGNRNIKIDYTTDAINDIICTNKNNLLFSDFSSGLTGKAIANEVKNISMFFIEKNKTALKESMFIPLYKKCLEAIQPTNSNDRREIIKTLLEILL